MEGLDFRRGFFERGVDLLQVVAGQVQGEADGSHTNPTFAEQIAAGIYQVRETEEWIAVNEALYVALEWKIDPESTAALIHTKTD
ncbi:MAG: hypothetical protein OXS33_06870 [bacterium]|nr:hypothetical protein [bacterium]MDE0502087.1 hypothetical protein [bacterium]